MFCHHLIESGKVQDLDLYHQKVLIKFDKILRNVQVYFLARFVFLLIIPKLSCTLTDSAW